MTVTTNIESIHVPNGYLDGVNTPDRLCDGDHLSTEVREVVEPFLSARIADERASPSTRLSSLFRRTVVSEEGHSENGESPTRRQVQFNVDDAFSAAVGPFPLVTPFVSADLTKITKLMAVLGIAGWISTASAVELEPHDGFVYAVGYDRATRENRRPRHPKRITEDDLIWEVFFMRWSVKDRAFQRLFVDDETVRKSIDRLVDLGCLSRVKTKEGERLEFDTTVSNTFEAETTDFPRTPSPATA